MQDLIIVGAGGWGIDSYDMICSVNDRRISAGEEAAYHILGFIDDNPDALNKWKGVHAPLLGSIEEWQPTDREHYVLGVANPNMREMLVKKLKARGAMFETIVSPDTWIPESVEMGEGCYISSCDFIGQNVKLGNFVQISGCSAVGQNVEIGDFSATGAFVNLASCKIGKRVFIGSHSVLLNCAEVGDDAFVSACSMVVSNVKSGTKVFGVPAKRVSW